MSSSILVRLLTLCMCVLTFTRGTIIRSKRDTEIQQNCAELDSPGWSVDNLKKVPLDAWPWSCLHARYNNYSLHEAISKVDLFDAAQKGYLGFVQYYAEKQDADLFKNREKSYKSPLILAIANGHLDIVKYIAPRVLQKNKLFACTHMLQFAAYYGQRVIVKYMLDELKLHDVVKDKTLILVMAIRGGNLDMLKYLVDERGYPLKKDFKAWLLWGVESGNIDVIKYLVHEKNITKNSGNREDVSLSFAAGFGDLQIVQFLIDNLNYEVNTEDYWGDTPVYYATHDGRLSVLKYLVEEKNGSLDVKNKIGNTLLHAAAGCRRRIDIAENALVDFNEDDWWKSSDWRDIRSDALDILEKEKDLYRPKNDFDDGAVMKFLIDDHEMINRINEVNNRNRTAASQTALCGQLATLKFLVDEKQADTTIVDWQGRNLLHLAVIGNHLPVVKYLVEEKQFDVNAENSKGETALSLAKEYGATPEERVKMVEYLESRWIKKDNFQ